MPPSLCERLPQSISTKENDKLSQMRISSWQKILRGEPRRGEGRSPYRLTGPNNAASARMTPDTVPIIPAALTAFSNPNQSGP